MAKVKTYKRLKGTNAFRAIEVFLDNHPTYKNSYVWSPPSSASGRRKMEFEFDYSFIFNGKQFDLEQSLTCSCANIYWSSTVYVDGDKKDIRALKKLLKN